MKIYINCGYFYFTVMWYFSYGYHVLVFMIYKFMILIMLIYYFGVYLFWSLWKMIKINSNWSYYKTVGLYIWGCVGTSSCILTLCTFNSWDYFMYTNNILLCKIINVHGYIHKLWLMYITLINLHSTSYMF